MKKLIKSYTLFALVLSTICIFFNSMLLAQTTGKTNITQEQHQSEMEALRIKRDSTLAAIQKMKLPELVGQMNKDSRTREHFNSPAYREVIHNRKSDGRELLDIITKQQKVTYIPLMALRKIDIQNYNKTDINIRKNALIDSFRQTTIYNRWGIPHLYWQAPAQSMIELGADAEKALKPFLKDQTKALIMGYEEELEMETYNYRKCDYALAMIMEIRSANVKEVPKKLEERDMMIKELLEE